jgi:hypothetical protein
MDNEAQVLVPKFTTHNIRLDNGERTMPDAPHEITDQTGIQALISRAHFVGIKTNKNPKLELSK